MITVFILFRNIDTHSTFIMSFDRPDNMQQKDFEILGKFKNLTDAQLLKRQYDEGVIY